jgi:hypothetical protein
MPFSIEFPPEAAEEIWEGEKIRMGRITLGDFTEQFMVFLHFWSPIEYEVQWRDAVRRIVSGSQVEALITEMHDLKTARHLVLWPMYREGDQVFVQNRLLFLENLGRPLKLELVIAGMGERQTVNKDVHKISQWSVSIDELQIFLKGR